MLAGASVQARVSVEVVSRTARTVVTRAPRDGRTVIVKAPAAEVPAAAELARYRHEFALLKHLEGTGVVRALELVENGGRLELVLEDSGARSVARLVRDAPLPVDRAATILLRTAEILARVHEAGVIHKDVNPSNLVWSDADQRLELIDFSIGSRLARERAIAGAPEELEGTLHYLAPEQSGRMTRGVDHRADLYSLGATAWHLLVGRPPFAASDPLALVHAHLAQLPKQVRSLRSEVPEPLSEIVKKLLAKDPDDRYQSAAGLAADLRRLLAGEAFELGAEDRPGSFSMPEKLYGRAAEQAALLEAFLAAREKLRVAVVAGGSGVGKSSLVLSLRARIAERGGAFAVGRFEMLRRDTPYLALSTALGGLVRDILAGSAAEVASWRERILAALGHNAGLLAVPGLDQLAGAAPPPPRGPEETRNRTRVAFAALIRAFTAERPLLLFLDDLQWADTASLELLSFLGSDPDLKQVLLVLGFRDDELAKDHPLRVSTAAAIHVTPGPLSLDDLAELVADTCRTTRAAARPLAELLLEKTAGNAFFARATLERMYRDGALRPDGHHWRWDLDAIRALAPAENVVSLMVRTLRELSEGAQDVLRKAACIGQRFELSVAAAAVARPPREVAAELWPALQAGLIVPEGAAYQLAEHAGDADVWYHFAHDRVQEAAVSLVPADERPRVHLAVGRALRDRAPEGEALFAAAAHLADALPVMEDRAERKRFAELALDVGRRARRTAAFETAFRLFEAGLTALGGWDEAPELARALSEASADTALLAGDVACMERRIDEVLARAKGPREAIAATTARVRARMAMNDMRGALAIAEPVFEAAGMPLATKGSLAATAVELVRTKLMLRKLTIEQIGAFPPATDPYLYQLHELRSLIPAAHVAVYPDAIPVAVLGDARIVARAREATGHGAWIWVSYAMLLAAIGDLDGAAAFAALSERECERLGRPDVLPRVRLIDLIYIRVWREETPPLIEGLERNLLRAIEVGDLGFAMRSAIAALGMMIAAGAELSSVEERLAGLRRLIAQHRLVDSDPRHGAMREMVRLLRAEVPPERPRLPAQAFADALAEPAAVIHEIHLALLFGDDERALELAERGFAVLETPAATIQAMYFWTYALVAIGAQREPRRREKKGLRTLERWIRATPATRTFRRSWIEAVNEARRGKMAEAVRAFDRAIDQARSAGFRHDAALIAEQASRFLDGGEYRRAARAYRQEAYAGYEQWGATAKVAQMLARHPELAEVDEPGSTASTTGRPGRLDLETVLRAAQILTGEIRLDVLVERLMALALENAGAERGALLLPRGRGWMLASSAGPDPAGKAGEEIDLDATDRFPATILRSAIRARRPLVLADGAKEWTARDAYVERRAPRSVLCLPLLDRDELSGLLYLENNLAPGAFTSERLEVLRTVSGQMAVSLRAAELYGETLELKRSFERFVPKDFLDNLRRNTVAEVRLGDSVQKEMTVLFTDMRSFTSLVEGMTPEENIEFINEYLGRMEPAILQHGGFVDSYIGDAIMALFDRGGDALSAAIEMLRELRRYNVDRAARGRKPVAIGAGVNTGLLTLGTIGGENRIKCGVIGDCVNLAARVESLTKSYQVPLLTTEHTRATLPDRERFRMRAVDRVRVVGRVEPVTLYEVYDADEESVVAVKQSCADDWERALEAYYGRAFDEAHRRFTSCARVLGADPIVARFLARAARHSAAPPSADWVGVEVLEHK